MNTMKQHEIDCFDIKDGTIVYKQRNVTKPMTKKTLLHTLLTFYQGDDSRAQALNQFILENRQVEKKETVEFKPKGGND